MRKALVFGATGLVGGFLLQQLLEDSNYSQVIAVTRKGLKLEHAKLKVLMGNFQTLSELKDQLIADDVFVALGTTKKDTPDEALYYQIDHDYPVLAAKLALQNRAQAVYLVSAVGADADSRFFYLRCKGETERDVIALGYPKTSIFRPSMILGNRSKSRPTESLLMGLFQGLNPLLQSSMKIYRGISAQEIAVSMVMSAHHRDPGVKILHWQEMKDLLKAD